MSRRIAAVAEEGDDTKSQLKAAAQSLFASYGVAAVTVQQIVSAAGQRNNAALHYHFGTKDDLIRQLLVEGAQDVDVRRRAMLAELEGAGGPQTVRQVMQALVLPVIALEGDPRRRGYIRLVANVQMTNRELLRSALADRWNEGYVRCLAHLRRIVTSVPAMLLEQRLSLLGMYSNAALSARDAALQLQPGEPHRLWGQPYTVDNMIDTLVAVIACEPSIESRTALGPEASGSR
ncbi:MAG: putative DNA-binding transcriptional regulator [Enterovirga sp.]|jgi:AcrR family transcriptional regulator|nr:putative DNA-binding transcriptional regulator [Enterovirga sp.]